MKKFISLLLIVSMLLGTSMVIFAGTALAVSEKAAVVAEEPAQNDYADVEEFILNFVNAAKGLWEKVRALFGGFGTIMDLFFDFLKLVGVDIDGLYDKLLTSGIFEWVNENIFAKALVA